MFDVFSIGSQPLYKTLSLEYNQVKNPDKLKEYESSSGLTFLEFGGKNVNFNNVPTFREVAHWGIVDSIFKELLTNFENVPLSKKEQEMSLVALMHDLVEDDYVSADDIYRIFGYMVYEGVMKLTDVRESFGIVSKNRQETKIMSIANLVSACPLTKLAKLSDRLHNLIRTTYLMENMEGDEHKRKLFMKYARYYAMEFTMFDSVVVSPIREMFPAIETKMSYHIDDIEISMNIDILSMNIIERLKYENGTI